MFTRRDFLKRSALIALAPTVPAFLVPAARAVRPERDGRVLVVIQLDGGNDGLNTVVPFADDAYRRHRQTLRLEGNSIIKLDDKAALHSSLADMAKLLQSGRLAIVQGVGYPNPSRSHVQSMAIWQTASLDVEDHNGLGWLGRGLDDGSLLPQRTPDAVFLGLSACPTALRSRRCVASAFDRPEDFRLSADAAAARKLAYRARGDSLAAFVERSTLDAYATADHIAQAAVGDDSGVSYPQTQLAIHLKLIARLLKTGLPARVYYTSQSGYDTHVGQLSVHANLLRELSQAIHAFMEDLQAARLADRVALMTFSEFGRQLRENASGGTDHGTAAPMFVVGDGVRAGLAGKAPSLTQLEDGEPKKTVDFRQVYAALLEQWLGLPSHNAVRGRFEPLPLLKS